MTDVPCWKGRSGTRGSVPDSAPSTLAWFVASLRRKGPREKNGLTLLILLQANVSMDLSWLDYVIIGVYFDGLVGSPVNAKSLGINKKLWSGLITVAFDYSILGMRLTSPHWCAARRGNLS